MSPDPLVSVGDGLIIHVEVPSQQGRWLLRRRKECDDGTPMGKVNKRELRRPYWEANKMELST